MRAEPRSLRLRREIGAVAHQPLVQRGLAWLESHFDKAIGALSRRRWPLGPVILMVSGRVGFEIAQKLMEELMAKVMFSHDRSRHASRIVVFLLVLPHNHTPPRGVRG